MSPIFGPIITGFIVKSIASFDDTLTKIPILAHLTRTTRGRIAFSVGSLLALSVILVIAVSFSFIFDLIPAKNKVLGVLIFLLGLAVYFNVFTRSEEKGLRGALSEVERAHNTRFINLFGASFIISFVTLIDDALVLIPLFIGDHLSKLLVVIGIYLAALVQIFLVLYFSRSLERLKYKKEIAALALMVLSTLVWFNIV